MSKYMAYRNLEPSYKLNKQAIMVVAYMYTVCIYIHAQQVCTVYITTTVLMFLLNKL